jgi:hypothetical protein
MIISASRRTDIPSYYSEWFLNRIKEGFVDVRNPLYPSQVSRYSLSPEVVDGIVFWTKNAEPMIQILDSLKDYMYYFQFSLTGHGNDVEDNLPDKKDIIETFKRLSDKIGPERVMWRYDPILLNSKYTFEYQIHAFGEIIKELKDYTKKVTISFIDEYKFGGRSIYAEVNAEDFSYEIQNKMAAQISQIAHEYGLAVDTCAEKIDLQKYGIEHARCVDSRVFEKLLDCKLSRLKTKYEELEKDKSQRVECCCIDSIDIGMTNTCLNGCKYCYATSSIEALRRNVLNCDPNSAMLVGEFSKNNGDKLTDHREKKSDSRNRSFKFLSQTVIQEKISGID